MGPRKSKSATPRRSKSKSLQKKLTGLKGEYQLAEVAFEVATESDSMFELRLYVAGMKPKSLRAITNVRRICEEHLAGRYELEVVDLYQNPISCQGRPNCGGANSDQEITRALAETHRGYVG